MKGFASQSRTFPTKGIARTWAERIEREHAVRAAPGSTDKDYMTVKHCIEWYIENEHQFAAWGRSKQADLRRLCGYEISYRTAAELSDHDYPRHIEGRRRMGAGPALCN